MVSIVRGPVKTYSVVSMLEGYFNTRTDIKGTLYFGYPIVSDFDDIYKVDAMLVSPNYGVILFNFEDSQEIDEEEISDSQLSIINSFSSRLMKNKRLMNRRTLKVNVNMLTLNPRLNNFFNKSDEFEYYIAKDYEEIDSFLSENEGNFADIYESLLQTIQAITTIKYRKNKRIINNSESRGAKLDKLEREISNLDIIQTRAVIETAEGPQRIRGLAGSGKTIVLALKVAYLHASNPDWNIAVTFNTRSLKDQFIDLIKRFTFEHTGFEPNWSKVKVIHAWGNPTDEGIYYNFCKVHGTPYYDFNNAVRFTGDRNNAFNIICEKALNEANEFIPMYDVILIDEAQDFSSDFLRMCYEILTDKKMLIFAYDELQSLNKNSMDTPENIFGKDKNGDPRVRLSNREGKAKEDIILETCYRNSRPILVTAHALGFGIYTKVTESLIQIFEDKGLWKEVGYDVIDGVLEDGQKVKLARSIKGSPQVLENHSDLEDIVKFKLCEDKEDQADWIVKQIENNLKYDELEYKDIMIVHTDPMTTRREVGLIREKLLKKGINSHLAGVSTSKDQFFLDDSITITSIFRAKGNEAAMVYVIDSQNCYSGAELSKKRNILFTAITRSKAWVRISGYGDGAKRLKEEFEEVKNNDFTLEFTYPTEECRRQMNIVHRDKTKEEKQQINTVENDIRNIVELLEKENLYKEDLPKELLDKLKGLIE